jgi:hypothetical protein
MKETLAIIFTLISIGTFGQANDTLYYQNGKNISRVINWQDSTELHYHENGKTKAIYRLVLREKHNSIDKYHLTSKEWYDNGTLKFENGKSQDTIIRLEYFPNGKLETRHKKIPDQEYDFKFVSVEKYCDNGYLKSTIILPARLDTKFEEFYCNGNLAISSDSIDCFGSPLGTVKYFDEKGNLERMMKTTIFSDPKRVQQHVIWNKMFDQNGDLIQTEYFGQNGELIRTEK